MKAEDIVVHPEFPYVNWNLAPTRKERIVIARGRGGPFRIAYEIHGKGPIHMVVSLRLHVLLFPWFLPVDTSSTFPIWEPLHVSRLQLIFFITFKY